MANAATWFVIGFCVTLLIVSAADTIVRSGRSHA